MIFSFNRIKIPIKICKDKNTQDGKNNGQNLKLQKAVGFIVPDNKMKSYLHRRIVLYDCSLTSMCAEKIII